MRLKIGVRAADRFDDAVDDRMEIVAVEAGVAEHQAFDVDERIVDDRRQRRRQVRQFRDAEARSEEHTSELQSLMRISYAVFCLKTKKYNDNTATETSTHTAKI